MLLFCRSGLLAIAALSAALCALPAAQAEGTHAHAHHQHAQARGGDFTLASPDGPVSLHDFRGKLVVIYFGYSYCPDICPTTLAELGAALKSLKPTEAAAIQPLFISFDPARDDAVRLKGYAAFFHPSMIGLTGTQAEIDRVAADYGVVHERVEVATAGGYVIDHTSILYVVDRRGKLVARLPHGTAAPAIARALRRELARR